MADILDPLDLSHAPGQLLRRCHQRSQEIFNDVLGAYGLTRQQTALMASLSRHPGASVQELADSSGVDRNTLTGVAARLIERKLVTRKKSTRDARAYDLRLTASGRALLAEVAPGVAEVQRRILEPLPEADRAIFIAYARILAGLDPA